MGLVTWAPLLWPHGHPQSVCFLQSEQHTASLWAQRTRAGKHFVNRTALSIGDRQLASFSSRVCALWWVGGSVSEEGLWARHRRPWASLGETKKIFSY